MTLTIAAMPAYNEENAISDVIRGCLKHVDQVVVVNDGSIDDTAFVAEEAGAYVINHPINKGYGAALRSCFETARNLGADMMVIIDSDGQHKPAEIPKLIEPLSKGFDVTLGSRFVNGNGKNVPNYRKAGMKVLDKATQLAGSIAVTDSQCGFRAYNKKAINSIHLHGNDMSAGSEILFQIKEKHLHFTEVPVHCRYDIEGTSSQHPLVHGPRVLLTILRDMEFRRPLYYFTLPGTLMSTTGFLMGLKFLQDYYHGEGLAFGPALFMMMLMIVGTFMIFTGIILHAVARMMRLSNR